MLPCKPLLEITRSLDLEEMIVKLHVKAMCRWGSRKRDKADSFTLGLSTYF